MRRLRPNPMPRDRQHHGASAGDSVAVELDHLPGHNIRRLQQIAVAVFLQETDSHGITPVQYAALRAIGDAPGIDQRSLARAIGFDTSTIAGVVDRLETRGLMTRHTAPEDRRARRLSLSTAGRTLLCAATPAILRAQARILAPLSRSEQAEFMRMLRVLVTANNGLSRAPSEA